MKRIIAMTAALLLSTAIAVASPPPEFKKALWTLRSAAL